MVVLQFQAQGRHSAMDLQIETKDNVRLSPKSSHTQIYFINSDTLNQAPLYQPKKWGYIQ